MADTRKKLYVQCDNENEADVLSKVAEAYRQASLAGILGDSWSITARRMNGGKIKVYTEGEAATLDAHRRIYRR